MSQDASFSVEQEQFRDVVARFLAERHPTSHLRSLVDAGQTHDPRTWQGLSREVGLTGLHLPEQHGGSGFGPVELGLVLEETGRNLLCGPWFASTVLAGTALLAADETAQAQWLPGLADGSVIGALLLDSLDDPSAIGRQLRADGNTLTGTVPRALAADVATQVFAIAATADGPALFALLEAPAVEPVEALDATRSIARVTCDNTPAERLALLGHDGVRQLWAQWSAYLACEQAGAADHLLHGTIDYMQLRLQFGRPIASFQALKHRCADLLLDVELAKALARAAVRAMADPHSNDDPVELAHMAKAAAGDASMACARQAIQLRGGIGFTWEEDTHWWFKRATANNLLFGTPERHRAWLIQHLETRHAA